MISKKNMRMSDLEFFESLVRIISQYIDIDEENMRKKDGRREVVDAKRMLVALFRPRTKLTLKRIGYMLGVDHATVIHYIRTHDALMQNNSKYRKMFEDVKQKTSEYNFVGLPFNVALKNLYEEKKNIDNLFKKACYDLDVEPKDIESLFESTESVTEEMILEKKLEYSNHE
jgi:predicted transcriptional regulator